jgi:rhamnosyltransferase
MALVQAMEISVVIPIYNAGPCFQNLLDSLETQSLKPTQITIIVSESTSKTREIAESRNCKVIAINRTDFDHGATRNLGVAQTDTEFVIFLTQDATPANKHMIAELIKPMQTDSSIAICYGRQLPKPDATPLERFAREFSYPAESILKTGADIKTLGIRTFFCSNSCSAMRRTIFEELGGFEDSVSTNEDMLFAARAIRAGYGVYYCAQAQVYHSHNFSFLDVFKRYRRIGIFLARFDSELAGAAGEGAKMFKAGVKRFWQQRQFYWLLVFIAQTVIKVLACYSGKIYGLIRYRLI